MEKGIDWEEGTKAIHEYVQGLVNEAKAVISQNPHLLRAFNDFMDVTYKKVDPALKQKWEHNAMWLLHHQFMQKVEELTARAPAYRKELNELTDIMKNIAQIVDLALLPKDIREKVEDWAKTYKKYFSKTKP